MNFIVNLVVRVIATLAALAAPYLHRFAWWLGFSARRGVNRLTEKAQIGTRQVLQKAPDVAYRVGRMAGHVARGAVNYQNRVKAELAVPSQKFASSEAWRTPDSLSDADFEARQAVVTNHIKTAGQLRAYFAPMTTPAALDYYFYIGDYDPHELVRLYLYIVAAKDQRLNLNDAEIVRKLTETCLANLKACVVEVIQAVSWAQHNSPEAVRDLRALAGL